MKTDKLFAFHFHVNVDPKDKLDCDISNDSLIYIKLKTFQPKFTSLDKWPHSTDRSVI